VPGALFGKAFFELQLTFAERVATIAGLPLERALLEYTNCYIRFGFGREFDRHHPGWQEYLAGLTSATDRGEWTHQFYVKRRHTVAVPDLVAESGCFAYSTLGADRIRIHFQNVDVEQSPLSLGRRPQRETDLRVLFAMVKRSSPQPVSVVGASWLYNVEAYRRLFPPSYLATAEILPHRFRHMPLWGQFLDRFGEVRPGPTREFRARLTRVSSTARLAECFPFQVLRLEAPVQEFYAFYDAWPIARG